MAPVAKRGAVCKPKGVGERHERGGGLDNERGSREEREVMENMAHKAAGSLRTMWEVIIYDVRWTMGGWQVNDNYSQGVVTLWVPVVRYSVGTEQEFKSAGPNDRQIKKVFGVRCRIDSFGDDLHFYVEQMTNGYPLGEMRCVSH